MSQPLLIAEEIGTVFDAPDRRVAVYSEYFELYPGDTVILQAPSGAGKSSLLALLGCALRPVHAKRFEVVTRKGDVINVALAWRENDEAALIAARRECFGFVLQTGALAPFLSVSQNITAARLFTPDAPPVDVSALAASLNIADLLNLRPPQLSVGQRQRVAIARALAGGPSVILADEPTASLDLDLADEVDGVLADAVRSSNACMIIASHRPDARVWRDVPRAETRTDRGHQMLATVFNHRNPKRRKAA